MRPLSDACLLQADIFHKLRQFMVQNTFSSGIVKECHVITLGFLSFFPLSFSAVQMKPSSPPAKARFQPGPMLSYVVSQVRVNRVGVGCCVPPSSLCTHIHLHQTSGSTQRPVLLLLILSFFQNYLSISDKQLHQQKGLRSVNTKLHDVIHRGDTLSSKHPLLPVLCLHRDIKTKFIQ